MSFLNQLKTQARALQQERTVQDQHLGELTARTEQACRFVLSYFEDLARQLNVIEPPGPAFSLDGKTPWPPMKLVDFRVDARRKMLRDREVFGAPGSGSVSVNFPTDMKRVEDRLAMGPVRHERHEVRDFERGNVLQAVRYEYVTQTRGSVLATADHEKAQLQFRLLNTGGFEVLHTGVPAGRIGHDLLDELAKRIVGEPNGFL
jgi:hypothetical protein